MKKIMQQSTLFAIVLIALSLGACNRKVGIGNPTLSCAAPTGAFLNAGSETRYFIKLGNTPKDSFATRTYTKLFENVYRGTDKIMPRDSAYVIHYLKACAGDLFISEIATNLDLKQNQKNMYMKGVRKKEDAWRYTYNGVTYNVGVKDTGLTAILLYDTIKVDKIWRDIHPQKVAADTFFWSDKYGQALFLKSDGKVHELYFANY